MIELKTAVVLIILLIVCIVGSIATRKRRKRNRLLPKPAHDSRRDAYKTQAPRNMRDYK